MSTEPDVLLTFAVLALLGTVLVMGIIDAVRAWWKR
jgi:hypothetical protein